MCEAGGGGVTRCSWQRGEQLTVLGIVQAPGDKQPREQCGPHGRVQVMWGARNKLGQLVHGPKKGGPRVFGDCGCLAGFGGLRRVLNEGRVAEMRIGMLG